MGSWSESRQAEFDIFGEQAVQHLFDPVHDRVQVRRVRVENLLPAEGEESLGQACCPVSGREYLLEVPPRRIIFFHAHIKECPEADDGAEDIVEIVSNAAGELADGLHLLCLSQQGFQVLFLLLPDTQGFRHGIECSGKLPDLVARFHRYVLDRVSLAEGSDLFLQGIQGSGYSMGNVIGEPECHGKKGQTDTDTFPEEASIGGVQAVRVKGNRCITDDAVAFLLRTVGIDECLFG